MDKILAEVYLPAAQISYDIRIPKRIKMFQAAELVSRLLGELAEGYFKPAGEEILCDRMSGLPYDLNLTPEEIGLMDGARMLLI